MAHQNNQAQDQPLAEYHGPALAAPTANPFERSRDDSLAAGTIAIESERAVAEAQGKLVIAKRFPRDPFAAFERAMNACKRPGLAGSAFYSFPRGGQTVSGPSIRLAEELARCWGNIDYGLRELSNKDGASEMEAYAWDMETNTVSSQRFTVRHLRDTKNGARELTDQRDIYEIGANMGARRLRARILAILPDDLVEAAVEQCRETIKRGGGESVEDRVRRTVRAFGALGVTVAMLESRLGHPLAATTPDELVDLYGIFQAIKGGQTRVVDVFGASAQGGGLAAPEPQQPAPAAQPAAKRGRKPKPAPAPEPEPEQDDEPEDVDDAEDADDAPAPANDNAPEDGGETDAAAPLAQPGDEDELF